ncbi:MAG: SDR family oxidoreductase [Acidobacteriota bacterium]|nr:SDR family oxidoreductase [Acidobacteriota bacterium]
MKSPSFQRLLDLSGKIALVTGAGRGIGAGIATRLAEAGAAVGVHYRSSAEGAERVAEEIRGGGGRACALSADVTQEGQVKGLIEEMVAAFDRLDILINNAGTYPVSPLVAMPEDQWDEVMAANLKSVHLCTQAAARQMIEQADGGSVVNVSSIEGQAPADLHAHYTSAKAGVIMHTRAAALELGRHHIRVNSVAPGLIWAEGLEEAWPDGVRRWLNSVPLGRLGQPHDVADACLFFAAPASRWITGATLTVDGGMLSSPIF